MKAKAALTLLLTAVNATAAIQCGSYEIDGSKYATRVNGDPVRMVSHRFTAAPGDYDNAVITLRRERITDQPFSFVLTAEAGRVSMEYVTDEDPPRVLNRENCRGSLREFARY
ncbi:hypothetical protein ACEV6Q_08320 [Enterobacter ludwigii]|uniref:hypothetical protein n=1 Tax=Enterobacter ludwigii TaxID=299767 RepID=UPI003BEED0C8